MITTDNFDTTLQTQTSHFTVCREKIDKHAFGQGLMSFQSHTRLSWSVNDKDTEPSKYEAVGNDDAR